MKKSILSILTLLFALSVTGCGNKTKSEKLANISGKNIDEITILALEQGSMTSITDENEIDMILDTIHSIPLTTTSQSKNTYSKNLIQYTLHKTNGGALTVDVLKQKIAYNSVWYNCDEMTCQQLSDLALDYLIN